MTLPRKQLVDVELTRYYHCISRCVRGAFLCGQGFEHRKQWIEARLELLANHFQGVSVCGYAILDSHFHVLVRLDPKTAEGFDAGEVVRRWIAVYPPRNLDLGDAQGVEAWVKRESQNKKRVEVLRQRLGDLGWFMKALKEPLARLANQEEDCKGTFWESRYKSIAILDEESLLATCVYIDLNPLAAGLSSTPETSRHTSLRQRVEHARECGKLDGLKAAARGSLCGSRAAGRLEESHWLCPLEDRRRKDSPREGMLESFSLGSYLLLVDYTSRLRRSGKARVSAEMAGIFQRLDTSSSSWDGRLQALFKVERVLGTHFCSSRERLRQLAQEQGRHHLDNIIPIPLSSTG